MNLPTPERVEMNATAQLEYYKARLSLAHEYLIEQHSSQADIERTVRRTAQYIDEIIIDAWRAQFGKSTPICVIAVGGYGRYELNFHSDIDLLFLHGFEPPTKTALETSGLDAFIQFLWDIGLDVGHSVRSVEDCLNQANVDIVAMTNMLDSRLLIGDNVLYKRFNNRIRKHTTWTNKSFYKAKVNEQVSRHQRFDDTTYKLEPNIKKSPGGLRDIQTISWLANKIYGTSDPDNLYSLGFLTEEELDLFKHSRNILWSIRNAMHILSGRAEDRLLFSHQQDIAASFGIENKPGLLAIEQLMQRYYRAAQDIQRLNELMIQLIGEQLRDHRPTSRRSLTDEFYIENGYICAESSKVFEQKPILLLSVFQIYQQEHKKAEGLSANCVRALRKSLILIDQNFCEEPAHLKVFLSIFKQEDGLTHTLRKMHAYGVLSAFLPVFGKIEGQMQHDLFHAYTVDAHTLMVIRNLRRCALNKFSHELPTLTVLMQKTAKRYRLYIAALFHDIAKGRGGNHDKLGALDAKEFATKLEMSTKDSQIIEWLVLNHLKMSKVSQREDLSDPDVIESFAKLVIDQEHLDNLYLLTVADIRGTSAATWTSWKGHLLAQLHAETSAFLSRQADKLPEIDVQISARRAQTVALLAKPIHKDTLQQYWEMLDDDYFLMYTPQTIAWHASAICHASALELPIVETRYIPDLDAEQYLIYTAETDVLLSTLTSVIDRFNQNIVQARIHAANPGFTIMIFTVTREQGVPDEEMVIKHKQSMRHALLVSTDHPAPIKKLLSRRLKQFSVKTRIKFSGRKRDALTVLRITTLDQPGLIHLIATALAECRVRLLSAHITTAGEKAVDRFHVCQHNARKSLTKKQRRCVQSTLLSALQGRDNRES